MAQRKNETISHFMKKELVGLDAKVFHKHSTENSVEGVIINESMSIIEIFDGLHIKKFIKESIDLDIDFGGGSGIVRLSGTLLNMRPEDRMKKLKIKKK